MAFNEKTFMKKIQNTLFLIKSQLLFSELAKAILVACGVYFLTKLLNTNIWISLLLSSVAFTAVSIWLGVFKQKQAKAKLILQQHNSQLEHSIDIFEKTEKNIAETLQLERLNLETLKTPFLAIHGIGYYVGFLILCFSLKFIVSKKAVIEPIIESFAPGIIASAKPIIPEFKSAEVSIAPPPYTGLTESRSKDLNISAIIGSNVTWRVVFENDDSLSVFIENSRGQKTSMNRRQDSFIYSDQIVSSGFYTIKATQKEKVIYQSEYFRIEAIPDLAPKITPKNKELISYHFLKDPSSRNISAEISDDFLVKDCYLIATVARGSGENVKFREVKLPLNSSNFKSKTISRNIDFKALKFSPGDELYYYWAAVDNKSPEPNISKSDTYFIIYKDTANVEEAELATMAMNIMPEYFRSQRQIIIDTEKLIKTRKTATKQAFNSASNEIGFDQKVLRLKYGQYLGEEFENSIGGGGIPEDAHNDGDMLKGFVHAHDSENHEDEPPKAGGHDDHNHAGSRGGLDSKSDPLAELMEAYVHSHDDGEMNTFYEQSTRSLLKSALEQMWQSELYLRTYEPEKALPYEEKALKLLKEAQQKARVYVKKTGFDPPPIKEKEKRLSGELTKFNNNLNFTRTLSISEFNLLVKETIGLIEKPKLNSLEKTKVIKLGQYLSSNDGGLRGISILKYLQKMANGKAMKDEEKGILKTALIKMQNADNEKNINFSSLPSNEKLKSSFLKKLK